MKTINIRKKLADYLQVADEKKVNAIYVMLEDEINSEINDWNEDFVKELDKRSKSFENKSARTYSWSETKKAALKI